MAGGGVREDIIERTDGVPLFVEEITKAVLEAESQRGRACDCGNSTTGPGGPRQFARLAHGAA